MDMNTMQGPPCVGPNEAQFERREPAIEKPLPMTGAEAPAGVTEGDQALPPETAPATAAEPPRKLSFRQKLREIATAERQAAADHVEAAQKIENLLVAIEVGESSSIGAAFDAWGANLQFGQRPRIEVVC